MSVYNQPTSNLQYGPGVHLASETPGAGSILVHPLVQGLHVVADTFVPDHSYEATESLSDSSSSSSSSSSSQSSDGDALSVDAYLQSDDANADDIHFPAGQPSEDKVKDDISDTSSEILDSEEMMLDEDCHPNAFNSDCDEPSTSLTFDIVSWNYIETPNAETSTYYGRRRPKFVNGYWHDVSDHELARGSSAVDWTKVERLARKWEAMQRRRETAERRQDYRLQMADENSELGMEQKERNIYLLEGEREMYRQQELREAAADEEQRMQEDYLKTRGPCSQCLTLDMRYTLEVIRGYREGLISEVEYIALRKVSNPGGNKRCTHRSRPYHNRFHPYSSSTKLARSNTRHFNTIDKSDNSYDNLLTAGRYAFKVYHNTWDWLTTPGNEVVLTFCTVPWPLVTSPYTPIEITESRVGQFLCRGLFDKSGLRAKERRCVLEEELRRWSPDNIETWIIPCVVDEDERVEVRQGAAAVHGALVLLMASE